MSEGNQGRKSNHLGQQKSDRPVRVTITEGTVKKGGHNTPPKNIPRPAKPTGQGGKGASGKKK